MARVAGYQVGFLDDPVGDGMCLSIFFAGCPRSCLGCHNEELQDPNSGEEKSATDIIRHISETLDVAELSTIVYLGGEPLLYREDVEEISGFAKYKGLRNVLYTGYTMEEIESSGWIPKLYYIDIIIDGPYMEWLHRDGFPASKNQRVWVNIGEGSFMDQTVAFVKTF